MPQRAVILAADDRCLHECGDRLTVFALEHQLDFACVAAIGSIEHDAHARGAVRPPVRIRRTDADQLFTLESRHPAERRVDFEMHASPIEDGDALGEFRD
jgi:hypothetical protein